MREYVGACVGGWAGRGAKRRVPGGGGEGRGEAQIDE